MLPLELACLKGGRKPASIAQARVCVIFECQCHDLSFSVNFGAFEWFQGLTWRQSQEGVMHTTAQFLSTPNLVHFYLQGSFLAVLLWQMLIRRMYTSNSRKLGTIGIQQTWLLCGLLQWPKLSVYFFVTLINLCMCMFVYLFVFLGILHCTPYFGSADHDF